MDKKREKRNAVKKRIEELNGHFLGPEFERLINRVNYVIFDFFTGTKFERYLHGKIYDEEIEEARLALQAFDTVEAALAIIYALLQENIVGLAIYSKILYDKVSTIVDIAINKILSKNKSKK